MEGCQLLSRNGTWCCGGDVDRDIEGTGSAPPTPPIITESPSSTKNPPHPVGDCPCGFNVKTMAETDNDNMTQLTRPWIAKILMTKDSGAEVFCTGSILNK